MHANESFKKTRKDRFNIGYVETKVETLNECWQHIFAKYHELLLLISSKDNPEDNNAEYETIVDEYHDAKFLMEEKIEELNAVKGNHRNEDTDNQQQGTVTQTGHLRLPRIPLPTFNGDYSAWVSFRDQFQSIIDNQPDLPAVQKLFYLKASLEGEAANLLKHFQTTESNYAPAWQCLLERYENKRILINTQLKILFSQANVTSETAVGIKKLLDTTNETLQQLTNLGIISDTCIVNLHDGAKTTNRNTSSMGTREKQNTTASNVQRFENLSTGTFQDS